MFQIFFGGNLDFPINWEIETFLFKRLYVPAPKCRDNAIFMQKFKLLNCLFFLNGLLLLLFQLRAKFPFRPKQFYNIPHWPVLASVTKSISFSDFRLQNQGIES